MIRRTLAHSVMLVLLAAPAIAWGAPKVALTAIDGDTEGELRDAVADALAGDDLTLIPKKEVSRATGRMGDAAELTEKQAKKLARDLAADAIIAGALEKEGATKVLRFKLFVNGKERKGFSVKFKSATSPKFKKALRKKMVEKLEGMAEEAAEEPAEAEPAPAVAAKRGAKKGAKAAAEPPAEEPEAAEEPAPKKGAKGARKGDPDAEVVADKRAAKKGGKGAKPEPIAEAPAEPEPADDGEAPEPAAAEGGAADGGEGGDSGEGGDGADEDKAKGKQVAAADSEDELGVTAREERERGPRRGERRAALRVGVGGSVLARRISFTSRGNLDAEQRPKRFAPAPVPGARVDGELYPMGLTGDGILARIGVGASYDRTLSMTVSTSAEPGVKVPTAQHRYSAGLRFRALGDGTGFTVTVAGDVGRSRFRPDRAKLMDPTRLDVPEILYKYIAPGLAIRIPAGPVGVLLGGDGMLILDAGGISRPDQYGKAKVTGFNAYLGAEIPIGRQFAVRVTGEVSRVGYQFLAPYGPLASERDGDPTTGDIGGAADQSFGGSVTFGLSY